MYVSYLKNRTLDPTGTYIQKVGHEKSGTLLEKHDLKEIILACSLDKYAKKDDPKHTNGAIFPYISSAVGKQYFTDETKTGGVIFIDIDQLSKKDAESIFNSFNSLLTYVPSIYGLQYSSSYYLKDDSVGLHMYVVSDELNEQDYRYSAGIVYAMIARAILLVTGIDLRVDGKLDTHNCEMTQRFYLHYSECKLNDDWYSVFNANDVDDRTIRELKKEYPDVISEKRVYIKQNITADDMYSTNTTKTRVCIDRNFHIGNMSGNDIRWRISRIAQAVFGEGAKEWCDRYFYCEGNNSIYTKQNSTDSLSGIVKEWLQKNGYLTNTKPHHIKYGEHISKYHDEILQYIKDNRHCEIVAPTGTGKTTLINGIKDYSFDLFCEDVNAGRSLAHELNAVVIVPFNVTNKLYDNMVEVSSESGNKVPADMPVVMIWDQALLHWEAIKDRQMIIDEAHCLFFDRTYRDVAVELMERLKRDNCRYALMSATPAGEVAELGCNVMKFTSDRDSIHTEIINVDHIDKAQYNMIKKMLDYNYFDHIVLFDDMTAKKIYEQLYCDGNYIDDIAYIRADTKESPEFKELRDKELLTKKLTICTCVAFNGLNFKNKGEKILVITSMYDGNTTANEIIQEAGRIRNSQVYLKIMTDGKGYGDDGLADRIEKAEIIHSAEKMYDIPEGLIGYENRLTDKDVQHSLLAINDYIRLNTGIDNIIKQLNDTGYFIICIRDVATEDIEKRGNRMSLALKKRESDSFIDDMMNDKMLDLDYMSNYKKSWQNKIAYMIDNDTYVGVTLDTFKKLCSNVDKKTLISTIIDKVSKAVKIALLSDTAWDNYANNVDKVKLMLNGRTVDIKKISKSYKDNKAIRDKYKDMINVAPNANVFDVTEIVEDVIAWEHEQYVTACKKKSDYAGRKGRVIMIDGIEYDSVKDAIVRTGLSRRAIYKKICDTQL